MANPEQGSFLSNDSDLTLWPDPEYPRGRWFGREISSFWGNRMVKVKYYSIWPGHSITSDFFFRWCWIAFYHGKLLLNHHLGNIFSNHLKRIWEQGSIIKSPISHTIHVWSVYLFIIIYLHLVVFVCFGTFTSYGNPPILEFFRVWETWTELQGDLFPQDFSRAARWNF